MSLLTPIPVERIKIEGSHIMCMANYIELNAFMLVMYLQINSLVFYRHIVWKIIQFFMYDMPS